MIKCANVIGNQIEHVPKYVCFFFQFQYYDLNKLYKFISGIHYMIYTRTYIKQGYMLMRI